jgi:hypothetical protein
VEFEDKRIVGLYVQSELQGSCRSNLVPHHHMENSDIRAFNVIEWTVSIGVFGI